MQQPAETTEFESRSSSTAGDATQRKSPASRAGDADTKPPQPASANGAGAGGAADQRGRFSEGAAESASVPGKDPSRGQQKADQPFSVMGLIQDHPVVAAAAAFSLGAAIVLIARSRDPDRDRLDRRAIRAGKSMEKTIERELRALRKTDTVGALERMVGQATGALSNVDFKPLIEQARSAMETARRKIG